MPHQCAAECACRHDLDAAAAALAEARRDEVVAAEDVVTRALELAHCIGANAPLAVQASKRIMYGVADRTIVSEREAWAINDREMAAVRATDDAQEGPRAFAERRAPRWQGQ